MLRCHRKTCVLMSSLVPHHGSGTSSGAAFLRAVQPEAAVFQLGFGNRYRHPRDDVWRRYGREGIARYRTDETGAVSIVTAGPRPDDFVIPPARRRYWRDAPGAPRRGVRASPGWGAGGRASAARACARAFGVWAPGLGVPPVPRVPRVPRVPTVAAADGMARETPAPSARRRRCGARAGAPWHVAGQPRRCPRVPAPRRQRARRRARGG